MSCDHCQPPVRKAVHITTDGAGLVVALDGVALTEVWAGLVSLALQQGLPGLTVNVVERPPAIRHPLARHLAGHTDQALAQGDRWAQ